MTLKNVVMWAVLWWLPVAGCLAEPMTGIAKNSKDAPSWSTTARRDTNADANRPAIRMSESDVGDSADACDKGYSLCTVKITLDSVTYITEPGSFRADCKVTVDPGNLKIPPLKTPKIAFVIQPSTPPAQFPSDNYKTDFVIGATNPAIGYDPRSDIGRPRLDDPTKTRIVVDDPHRRVNKLKYLFRLNYLDAQRDPHTCGVVDPYVVNQ